MSAAPPDILVRSEGLAGLVWTVLVSAAIHVAVVGALLVASHSFFRMRSSPLVSYSVELVAPDRIGGTNLRSGSAAKPVEASPAHPLVPARPAPPQPAAPVPVLPPKPPEVASAPEPATSMPVPVAPKAKAETRKVPPQSKAVAPPPPPRAKADPKKAVEAKPLPKAEARPPAPSAQAPARDDQKAVAPEAPDRAAVADPDAQKRDQAIVAAIERRAGQAAEAPAGVSRSGGGPISIGPGTGSGGTTIGLEFALYYNAMITRIKQNWVWVGANNRLEAVVQFNISREGAIINVRTVRSSGDPSYDASVERAVRAASPLAPPPEQYRDTFVEGVEITFRPEDLRS